MLAITTDMQAPKDLDVISVFVATGNDADFDYLGRVPPVGSTVIPATLAIVEPENPNDQIHIRVVGFKDQNALVLRDVLTTVPQGRTALLRLPLDFLDDGSAQGQLPAGLVPDGSGGGLEGDTSFDSLSISYSSCDYTDKQQTSIDGQCVSAQVDPTALPAYDPSQVYGNGGVDGNGLPVTCFDTASCFAGATAVTNLDASACTFPFAGAASTLNLALVTTSTGACDASGQCFVPLENDATDGWTLQNGTVHMAPGVCSKIAQAGAQLFVSTSACPSKQPSNPVCEPGEEPDGTTTTSPGATLNPHGTVVVPNGAKGVAIVHIEDASGNLMTTPVVTEVAAMGDVVLVAEPADLSQGVVATTTALQTLNDATTSPSITDDVPTATIADGGAAGAPVSVAVFAGSTFSSVQMQDIASPFTVCFTGGLHLAQNQLYSYTTTGRTIVGQCASADGTVLASTFDSTEEVLFEDEMATLSPHSIGVTSVQYSAAPATATVTGRGAMAFDPTTPSTMLYAGANGVLYTYSNASTRPLANPTTLPGATQGASVAYASDGTFAVVATNAGLFTVTVGPASDGGEQGLSATIVSGPTNPSYVGADGNTYTLSGAQSVAITSDDHYLIALTDQPSPTSGTLVVLPVDASGVVGAVGATVGGFQATANADVLSAY